MKAAISSCRAWMNRGRSPAFRSAAVNGVHRDRAARGPSETLDLAAHQPQRPTESSAEGVTQADHSDDLHARRLQASLGFPIQQIRRKPNWVVEVKVAQEHVELLSP